MPRYDSDRRTCARFLVRIGLYERKRMLMRTIPYWIMRHNVHWRMSCHRHITQAIMLYLMTYFNFLSFSLVFFSPLLCSHTSFVTTLFLFFPFTAQPFLCFKHHSLNHAGNQMCSCGWWVSTSWNIWVGVRDEKEWRVVDEVRWCPLEIAFD